MRCTAGMVALMILAMVSLFVSTTVASDDFQTIALRSQAAIVLISVGEEDATGFLIANEPPLIASVAHSLVGAKPEDIHVRANTTGSLMSVVAVHVHPEFKKGNLLTPDVSLLELRQLGEGMGQALKLANISGIADMRGHEVMSIGFPTYSSMTAERKSSPEAGVRRGLIHRLVDFDLNTNSPLNLRPLLQHDCDVTAGESGSPLISLSTGMVVGIHNGPSTFRKPGTDIVTGRIGRAANIDVLRQFAESVGYASVLK